MSGSPTSLGTVWFSEAPAIRAASHPENETIPIVFSRLFNRSCDLKNQEFARVKTPF
jgi:hypothetical protein